MVVEAPDGGGTNALRVVVAGAALFQSIFMFDSPKATVFVILNVPILFPVVGTKVPFDEGLQPLIRRYGPTPTVKTFTPPDAKAGSNSVEPAT